MEILSISISVNCTFFFFSFRIVVKDCYGKDLLNSYCGLGERAFLNTSTLNISVEVRAYRKYNTFTARYAILNGSIYKGKEFGLSCFRSVCPVWIVILECKSDEASPGCNIFVCPVSVVLP